MAKKVIQRTDSFSGEDDDMPTDRPYMPMDEANQVYTSGITHLPNTPYISPKVQLRETQEENQTLRGQLDDLMQQLQSRTSDLLVQDGSLIVHDFQFTPTGLIAPEYFSLEAWQQLGILLFKLEGSIQWLIGDWIVYGEQVGWGDLAKLAEALGRKPKTLYDYSYVSRNVQFSVRTENLSWAHHSRVASLPSPQQAKALDYAIEQRLSVNAFRRWIDEQRGKIQPDTFALSAGDTPSFKSLARDLDKFMQHDPSKAKPQDHEQVRAAIANNERAIEALKRKWGLSDA